MPLSRNPNSFTDVRLTLEAARASGGGWMRFATYGKAMNWRQRAYHFRDLLRRQAAQGMEGLTIAPATPWDDMSLTVEMIEDKKPEPWGVKIEFGASRGTFEPFTGAPAPKAVPAVDAEMTELAKKLFEEKSA